MKDVRIISSMDGHPQPALFYSPRIAAGSSVPLVVGLHPWSHDHREKTYREYLAECRRRGWALICPNFRGPNVGPDACASDLAVQDVLDAVDFARRSARIDAKRILVVGVSGGGHMTLILAGRAPKLWAAVSAWVPIADLATWHADAKASGRNYWRLLEAVCGGPPGASAEADRQYKLRSPLTYLGRAGGLAVDIQAGVTDGHTGSVPIRHSLRAFNLLARANGRKDKQVAPGDIRYMVERQAVPSKLAYRGKEVGRKHAVLFRRQAGPARVTIFQGGHEIDVPSAFRWLEGKRKR